MTNEDIQIPDEYKEKSRQIEQLWEVFLETGENLDRVVLEMRTILIDAGLGATEAMNRIVQDHKHLKGFSRATLYRMLPAEEKRHKEPPKSKQQFSNENYVHMQETRSDVVNIPHPEPNIVDVELPAAAAEEPEDEPIIQQQQERRTPEAPDHSMVEQLHHINLQLKKEKQDLEELMDMRMADKDKRIHGLVKDLLDRDKAIELLTEENTQLKAELTKHRRLEELRLNAQREAIKQWKNPGHKPT